MLVKALVYGIPSIGIALILGPVSMVLSGIYTKYGASLSDDCVSDVGAACVRCGD